MNPVYFETHFQRYELWSDWPEAFAIITAYATTGQQWSDEQNQAADQKLEAGLRHQSRWMRRLTGYSPRTLHAEPGWAVELDFLSACDIGRRFKQDALYYVEGDTLWVGDCAALTREVVGSFRDRVHLIQPS